MRNLLQGIQKELAEMQAILKGNGVTPEPKPAKRPRKARVKKPEARPRQCTDASHGECKMVAVLGSTFELIKCPWCEFLLSPSNPYQWCANCYTLYKIVETADYKVAHFGKGIERPLGVALAIALAKSGGARFGDVEVGGDA